MNKNKIKYYLYKFLPQNLYLKIIYKWYHKKSLNIKNPQRYTEKLFLLKIKNGIGNTLPLIQKVYDKYTAREYITEKGFGNHIPRLYGVYKDSNDIIFEDLPDKYVLKVSQANGFNFVNNGVSVDEQSLKDKFNIWLKEARDTKKMKEKYKEEHYYFNGQAVIICEEFLSKKNNIPCDELLFFCFNGEPKIISHELDIVDSSGNVKKDFGRNTYDLDWNLLSINMGRKYDKDRIIEKPKNLEELIEIAKRLSEPFKFARVDFFLNENTFYIGEITFIPQGASCPITPDEFDDMLGKWLDI